MLEIGTKAPAFSLPDQNGTVHTLEEYKGKKVVLYFYSKDNTSGCSKQACGFAELYPQFMEKGAVILGVSKDSVASHKKFEEKFGRTAELINFLENDLGLKVSEKIKGYLLDSENPHFLYDLLGVLKADTGFFYIDADEEMPVAEEIVAKALSLGAIPAYAYLGDVGESVTGDKKAQKFEDDYLPELLEAIKGIGIKAVAYMPTRNTPEQLARVSKLCKENGLFEISGEDVNSPRQKFECAALADDRYSHLITSTWALIGHEAISSEKGVSAGMFSAETIAKIPDLQQRIKEFAEIGRNSVK